MLRASVTFAVVLSLHDPDAARSWIAAAARAAAAGGGGGGGGGGGAGRRRPDPVDRRRAPPACRRSTATSRSTGTSAPARCSSKSRGSTPSSCSRPASPPGLGSNDIGLDRGAGGGGAHRRVPARRPARAAGAAEPCRSDRAAPNPLERKSVEDSFAKSILWGFTVAGRERTAASWSTRPTSCCATCTGAGSALRPGTYRVDRTRSAFYLPRTQGVSRRTPKSR